nr:hypothetical protein BgiMline_009061 [Biomphalaria glabrata]
MMQTFLEDAENSLNHRATAQNGSQSSNDSDYDDDDPFLYDQFLHDPDWAKANREEVVAKVLVDPGPFRYNKRVFVTSLPAALLVLALGGETLVLMAAVGTALLAFMSQLGDSRRCVITFVIIFIPSHTYILASVVPLLWLSGWHSLLIALVNLFVILTAGWVLLQFKAFRMEEPTIASVIEQMLFTIYPLVCTGLVCWALGAVISTSVIPVIFSCIWFVLLQLYLVPTLSSFKTQLKPDDNLDVVQVPIVVATVVVFVLLGPLLHIFLSFFAADAPGFTTLFFVHLLFLFSLSLFLSTLLSISQIFEYLGLPTRTSINVRWISGIICTSLSYPVLHAYGLDSHFLPLLPVAIGIFAALGVVLAFKKKKVAMGVLALVLALSLIALFILWIQRMPHNLQQYFLGIFPLNTFYFLMCANFLLCLLCLWMASINAKELLGVLIILQAFVLTICEISLHNSNFYSATKIQLTAITASYTLHRLQVSDKITRQVAIIATGIHTAKSLASATSVVLDGDSRTITMLEMSALMFMTYSLVSVFLYGTVGEKSGMEVLKQLLMLLVSLAINSHQLLLPVSMMLFQGSTSFTNVIGLWCMIGGGLVLLYSQAISSIYSLQILKVALALGVMGICVMILHPQLAFSFHSVFQWSEILSLFSLAAILSLQVKLTPNLLVIAAIVFSVCPGMRASLYLWSHLSVWYTSLCVVDTCALLILVFVCVFILEMTEASDKIMKFSIVAAMSCSLGLLLLDICLLMPTFWYLMEMPAWKAILVTCLIISITLKVVMTTKGPDRLPTSSVEERKLSLPLIANIITLAAFLVACSQGPSDPVLHDLWCCTFTTILGCLHQDHIFLPRLTGDKQATPTIMASLGILIISTICRSRLWSWSSFLIIAGGMVEVILVFLILPVFYVAWGILWRGQILSEPAVVFLTPYSILLILLATTYSTWILAVSCLVAGMWMMMYKLPMVPYNSDSVDHYR